VKTRPHDRNRRLVVADETCRAYQVDGEPVVVRGDRPLTEEDQGVLGEIVRAARKYMADKHDTHPATEETPDA
jgi:hypothetical protein